MTRETADVHPASYTPHRGEAVCMAMYGSAWASLVALALGGCASWTFPIYTPHDYWDGDYWEDDYWEDDYWDDDDACDGTTQLEWYDYDCSAAAWWYSARVDGWASDAMLNIHQSVEDYWDEEHDLPSETYDTCWDQLRVDLDIVTDWADQEADRSTLYPCEPGVTVTLTWMIRVWDTDNNMSDCAVWGLDPDHFSEYGCLVRD